MHDLKPTPSARQRFSHALHPWHFWIVLLVVALLLLFVPTHVALGETRGTHAQGRPFVSGGVGAEAQQALYAKREDFSLWVVTAAKRSGAYLADARLKITDADNRVVFDAALDGPWLFIDLALGRYTLQASYQGQTQRTMTTIHPGDRHQALFYFDVPEEVSSTRTTP